MSFATTHVLGVTHMQDAPILRAEFKFLFELQYVLDFYTLDFYVSFRFIGGLLFDYFMNTNTK